MPPSELIDYVRAPDNAFSWKRVSREGKVSTFQLVSQRWQGMNWIHRVVLVEPERRLSKDAAILYVTGGEPNPLDLEEATRLAALSGLSVAHLFHIPNQPLYELWEDDLVAHTFVQYLDTGDPTWPLLLPMTKAAVRAMDGLQSLGYERFVVTGASKRGWTAWLTGAVGDPRVIGIAPMVYDNLNISAQLQHQHENWNTFSDMISPYTSRGLHERVATPEGQHLTSIIDPYTYRDAIEIPKMIVTGTNDPYWSVDSASLYWEGLVGPKWISTVPNAGHVLGDMSQALGAIAALARHCAGRMEIPPSSWAFEREVIELRFSAPLPEVRLWVAESSDLDFRPSRWDARLESGAGRVKAEDATIRLRIPQSTRNQAVMAEMRYGLKDLEFSVCSPVQVIPSRSSRV